MNLKRGMYLFKGARGKQGKFRHGVGDIIDAHYYWSESTPGTEVAGDGAANGTSICTLSIAAYKHFICTNLVASTDVGAVIRIGTGSLAAMTDIYVVDLMSGGGIHLITEKMPIFEVDNHLGTSALTLIMYAPKTAKGSGNNNDVNHHFDGFMGGLQY